MVAAVNQLNGEPPREKIQIILRSTPGSGAVPFARILRGRFEGIRFYVDPGASLQDLKKDWTAYHEFSHLFIPYPGDSDLWLSEGLASFYQNVLQRRAELLSEQQTWQKLYDGFKRGESNSEFSTMTLSQLSENIRQSRSFMRIYWSGALYFFEADVALRQGTEKKGTGKIQYTALDKTSR